MVRHRLHHRFTDSENDPYNSKRGFFFSHIGWIFTKPRYAKRSLIDTRDLDSDSGSVALGMSTTRSAPFP